MDKRKENNRYLTNIRTNLNDQYFWELLSIRSAQLGEDKPTTLCYAAGKLYLRDFPTIKALHRFLQERKKKNKEFARDNIKKIIKHLDSLL